MVKIVNGCVVADDPRAAPPAARQGGFSTLNSMNSSSAASSGNSASANRPQAGLNLEGVSSFLAQERMIFRKLVKTQWLVLAGGICWWLMGGLGVILFAVAMYVGSGYGNTDAFWQQVTGGSGPQPASAGGGGGFGGSIRGGGGRPLGRN
eukprot:gnl/Spiro4/4413_TR2189_c0_g1_i1.p1 gnl/Spiro4/4413_TR2189_c0_g1~~gnl/Spiro4/4413_TR2189_c0_g1_i1.p1  ORF type:complete len:163 (-),score=31.21 gnl/Spiro4/4413_TR2189_c0_g1_i1:4-453(-)